VQSQFGGVNYTAWNKFGFREELVGDWFEPIPLEDAKWLELFLRRV